MNRCEYCGRLVDRPSANCEIQIHPEPDLAERIVDLVESELNDRNGLEWSAVDEDTLDGLRRSIARQIREELTKAKGGI